MQSFNINSFKFNFNPSNRLQRDVMFTGAQSEKLSNGLEQIIAFETKTNDRIANSFKPTVEV